MPDLNRIKEFEQRLAALKTQREAGEISTDEYVDQAGALHFVDETDGQEWWLDPETAQWYVAPAGAENFELASPQPGEMPEPPLTHPQEEPLKPEEKKTKEPEGEVTIQAPTQEPPTTPPPVSQEGSLDQESSPSPDADDTSLPSRSLSKLVLGVVGGLVVLIFLLAAGLYLKRTFPTITTQAATVTATPTPVPTLIPTLAPTSTSTLTAGTSQLGDTLTPTSTSTPLPTSISSSTPTSTPSPTDTATATATPTPEPEPHLPPAKLTTFSGKLAYSFYDPDQETFVIQVVDLASGQTILTLSQASQPALTSDGQQLAYHSWDPQGIGLFAVSLTNQLTPRVISRFQESQRPQWGPDNHSVAFSFLQAQDGNEMKTIQFSDKDRLPIKGFAQTAAWTPDGRLVFNACQGSKCGLAIAHTNGTGFAFLTGRPQDISPAVSYPDGQWITYISAQDSNWDVYRISITGGQPTRLTSQPGKDGIPIWSPDGTQIAYVSEQNGSWAIWVMTLDGGNKEKVLNLPGPLEGRIRAFPDDAQRGWQLESISWSR